MINANTPLRNKILISNTVITVLMLALGAISYTSLTELDESNNRVDHTASVVEHSLTLEGAAVDMETGMRGYLLAGKEDFLEPYNGGKKRFYDGLKKLRAEVAGNQAQLKRLDEIEKNITGWITKVTEPAIELRRKIGDADTMNDLAKVVAQAKGKQYFDRFRGQIKLFTNTERALLEKRNAELKGQEDLAKLTEAIGWVNHTHEVINQAMLILGAAVDMETGMRGFLLAGKDEFMEPFNRGSDTFDNLISQLQVTVSDNPPQVALLGQMKQTIGTWRKGVVTDMLKLRREIGNSKTMDDMADLVGEARGKTYFDKFRGQIAEFKDAEKSSLVAGQAEAKSVYWNSVLIIFGLSLVSVVASIGLALFVSRSITAPFRAIFGGLSTFSQNELEELSKSFNDVVRDLTKHSTEVAEASRTIATSSSGLSSNTNEQASAVEETSASIEEMNGIVRNNTSIAQKSLDLSTEVTKNVEELSRSFKKIEESNVDIENLVKVIQEIGEKTRVIDEIVFQTKLLSFNASVEAERAGEHGRGFAVVAQEVGNLAALSGKAAVEISAIVKDSTEKGAIIARDNAERVEQGASAMRKTSELIDSVSKSSQKIVEASKEQAKGVDQINQAIHEINSATQDSASIAADTSRSSSDLNDQASAMNTLVSHLNFYLSGHNRAGQQGLGHHHSMQGHMGNSGQFGYQGAPTLGHQGFAPAMGHGPMNQGHGAQVVPFPGKPVHSSPSQPMNHHPQPFKQAVGDSFAPQNTGLADTWEEL